MPKENNKENSLQTRSGGVQFNLGTIVGIVGIIATILTAWGTTSTRISLLENDRDTLEESNKILVLKIENIYKTQTDDDLADQQHDHDNQLKILELENRLNQLEKKK